MNNPHLKLPTEELVLLNSHVNAFIRMHAPSLNPITQQLMSVSLTMFIQEAVAKFEKGQKEHANDPEGSLLQNRNLDKEIRQETVDLFWYTSAKNWPNYIV